MVVFIVPFGRQNKCNWGTPHLPLKVGGMLNLNDAKRARPFFNLCPSYLHFSTQHVDLPFLGHACCEMLRVLIVPDNSLPVEWPRMIIQKRMPVS